MERLDNLKNKGGKITEEVRMRGATYIAAGFGIVVGLAWNEAIKSLIDYFYPLANADSIFAKFLYATALTIIVVILTTYIVRVPEK